MVFVDSWDSGLHGADWDSGLQWDVNVGPSPGDISAYLALVTSEHRDKPKFIAFLTGLLQPLADTAAVVATLITKYDLDTAAGTQLDVVGKWVGVPRNISVPLPNVYFSFDIEGLGLDQAAWLGPDDPVSGLVVLFDDAYRTLLRARIVNNQWDGSIPGAYDVWDAAFAGTGVGLLLQDLQNMHMLMALTGPIPDAVTLAMFTNGFLNVKPAGVTIDAYFVPSIPDTPYFGLGAENSAVAGFDVGQWGTAYHPGA